MKVNLKNLLSAGFMAGSIVLTVIAVSLYATMGATTFNPEIDGKVVAVLIVEIVIGAVSLVFQAKLGEYASYLILLYGLVAYISTQVNYIANVFVAIDGETFSAAFLCTLLCLAFGMIAGLVAAILNPEPLGKLPWKKAEVEQ